MVCLGDSMLLGEGDEQGMGGWVGRLPQVMPAYTGGDERAWYVFNLGVSKHTVIDFYHRLGEVMQRDPDVLLIGCGGNDVKLVPGPDGELQENISFSLYESHWPRVLDMAKAICPKVLYLGPLIKRDITTPNQSVFQMARLNHHAKWIASLCETRGIESLLFDLHEVDDSCWAEDKLHYNSKGHEIICELVYRKLEKLGWV